MGEFRELLVRPLTEAPRESHKSHAPTAAQIEARTRCAPGSLCATTYGASRRVRASARLQRGISPLAGRVSAPNVPQKCSPGRPPPFTPYSLALFLAPSSPAIRLKCDQVSQRQRCLAAGIGAHEISSTATRKRLLLRPRHYGRPTRAKKCAHLRC